MAQLNLSKRLSAPMENQEALLILPTSIMMTLPTHLGFAKKVSKSANDNLE
jgi:hypothetical protein